MKILRLFVVAALLLSVTGFQDVPGVMGTEVDAFPWDDPDGPTFQVWLCANCPPCCPGWPPQPGDDDFVGPCPEFGC